MIRDFLSAHKTECGAYALVLTLCFSLFVIYDAFSGTAALFLIPGTLLICAAYFFLCAFVEKHRFIGSVLFGFVLFIVVRLFIFFSRRHILFPLYDLFCSLNKEDIKRYTIAIGTRTA